MIPLTIRMGEAGNGAPRASGDDPEAVEQWRYEVQCSPRERG